MFYVSGTNGFPRNKSHKRHPGAKAASVSHMLFAHEDIKMELSTAMRKSVLLTGYRAAGMGSRMIACAQEASQHSSSKLHPGLMFSKRDELGTDFITHTDF